MAAQEYHEVFVPFPDVYTLGGPDVFKHLERKGETGEKNCVVIPFEFIEELDRLESKENSFGAEEVQLFIKDSKDKKDADASSNNSTIYHIFDGLDIAIIKKESETTNFLEGIEKLEQRIKTDIKSQNKLKNITNKKLYHIDLFNRGLTVEDPKFLQVSADIVDEGVILGTEETYAQLQQNNRILPAEIIESALDRELYVNQFIKFRIGSTTEFARVTADLKRNSRGDRIIGAENRRVKLLDPEEYYKKMSIGNHHMDNILGIKPRDMEQYLAFQYGLLDREVPLFFICGSQGSGKTLLAYAAAIDQVLWQHQEIRAKRGMDENEKGGYFKQIILLKPNDVMGGKKREVGFLPGTLLDKLRPFLESYNDAHKETILEDIISFDDLWRHPKFDSEYGPKRSVQATSQKINGGYLPPNNPVIEMTYSGFLRGVSKKNTLFLIDEAPNFTPYELKTALERLGPGSAAIVMGDPFQIDNPLCSREVNGLTHAIKIYLPKPYSALINLAQNYRHQISEDTKEWKVYSS